MNKDLFNNLILDKLAAVNKEKCTLNLSKDRLIYLAGQREALTNLLEELEQW